MSDKTIKCRIKFMASPDYNRQIKAVMFVKEKGEISNKEYQVLKDCSRNTATNDLSELLNENVIISSGKKGAGSFYKLKK